MTVTVLHKINEQNPSIKLTYVSRYPDFFQGMEAIDELVTFEKGQTDFGHFLGYDHLRPPPRPLITMIAETAGLELDCTQLVPPNIGEIDLSRLGLTDSPEQKRIVIQPMPSKWTSAKQWPYEHWVRLIELLTEKYQVIEVGKETFLDPSRFNGHFKSTACRTSLKELAAVIRSADLFIGPPSGGMHMANAFEIPSIIIFGGYEKPEGYNYPRTTSFYNQVECAPCWIYGRNCSIGTPCLKEIRPEQVFQSAVSALS